MPFVKQHSETHIDDNGIAHIEIKGTLFQNEAPYIVAALGGTSYEELIADLMSANLICSFEQDEESFIKITTEGKNALELTKSLLPGLLKLKADTIFKEENSNIVEESSVVTEFIPKDENNYTITCKIVEQNETIFEVSVYAASREKAKQISDNWKSNATTLYPQILELLSNNKDGANINE